MTDHDPVPGPGVPRGRRPPPQIIQGGMGVAISGRRPAAAVAATGQLGVVSGTALEVVRARRLQAGDPGGHVRRALAADLARALAGDPDTRPDGFVLEGSAAGGHNAPPERQPVCDLGVLRSAYVTSSGTVDHRCPAEPRQAYLRRKGGHEATMRGRVCLCNALMASAGMPQRRRNGYVGPPIVTAGNDFTTVERLLRDLPAGRDTFSATAVVRHLLGPPS